MTTTLAAIEAAQSKLADDHARINAMIDELKKLPRATEYRVDAVTIPLAAGERIAGAILDDDGTINHYVILLPGEAESVNWEDAKAWAAERDGELPTRREQSLLFANLKSEFESAWYWSCEAHETKSGWAWSQDFGSGGQNDGRQGSELRARAVRRFIPSVI
ncbi:DUF1566 domain-containing protein [Burkholderia cepacia]|uniref:DUF1566 domain-containing protein n=1 Tax=Burkholderia cepacia TaxID=292 RepID=UPI001CF5F12F|nr:DUF1566 domain-containing protein [Burkholderia cepacia]MCA8026522.1 DUF1566 domain-containing protein [Burkholderia cepacia]